MQKVEQKQAAQALAQGREAGFAEHGMTDVALAGEIDQHLRDVGSFKLHHLGSEQGRQAQVVLQHPLQAGVDAGRVFTGSAHIDHVTGRPNCPAMRMPLRMSISASVGSELTPTMTALHHVPAVLA